MCFIFVDLMLNNDAIARKIIKELKRNSVSNKDMLEIIIEMNKEIVVTVKKDIDIECTLI